MRVRYTDEQKEQALQLAKQIGIPKAGKELGITLQTMYKWAKADKEAAQPAAPDYSQQENAARALLSEDTCDQDRLAYLEAENARLRQMNDKLRKALRAFVE